MVVIKFVEYNIHILQDQIIGESKEKLLFCHLKNMRHPKLI